MPIYERQGLDALRAKVVLLDILRIYLVEASQDQMAYIPHEEGRFFQCPFCINNKGKKNASFSLFVRDGEDHCFCSSCGMYCESIGFIAHYLEVGFCDAVEALADFYNVDLKRVAH